MKCITIQNEFGLENLGWSERPQEELTDTSVRVSIKATSLNYRDYLMVVGKYNPRQKLPLIPNSDGAGEVTEVGSKVKKFKVGDRVSPIFAQDWMDGNPNMDVLRTTLGGPLDGCLASERVFPEHGLVSIPDNLSFAEAAGLGCAGLTAYNAVVTYGNIRPGSTVLILGTGGVSIFALQFAKMMGARVILTSSSDQKLEKGKSLGADVLINYKSKTNWEREVRRATGMQGADLIIEVGGAGTMSKSMMSVKPGGTIALIGVLDGGEGNLSLYPILMQGVRVQGIIVGNRAQYEEMNRAIVVNQIRPVLDKEFHWSQIKEAFQYLEKGNHFGKIPIQIS
jgi:NADPH:quinone reductase-like Zn-dependent oxidoreductase